MSKINAWIYCSIDAPEDAHGALKGQYEQLERYAEQMGFTVVGSSQDMGTATTMQNPGIAAALEGARIGAFTVLLVTSLARLGHQKGDRTVILYALAWYGITLYSPQEGRVSGLEEGRI